MADDTGLNDVLRNLNAIVINMSDAGQAAAFEIAALLESYAKSHHLWKPDTGQTDLTTEGLVEVVNGNLEVALTAATPWAVFLELAHQGRYAWLWPAMDANRKNMLDILRKHLGGVRL